MESFEKPKIILKYDQNIFLTYDRISISIYKAVLYALKYN